MNKFGRSVMQKIKTFGNAFVGSVSKPAYYRDILKAKFSFSLKYLISLLFLISLIFGIESAVRVLKLVPQVPNFLENSKKYVVENYPKDLKLTLKDKKISSNVKEPYFVDLPQTASVSGEAFKHFLAIDTKGKPEDFVGLESVLVLTADSLVVSDGAAGYKNITLTNAFNKIPDGTNINKGNLDQTLTGVQPYFATLLPKVLRIIALILFILYPVLRTVVVLAFEMVVLLPTALILFVFAKLAKREISYAKMYQFSLHGLTIPVLISFALGSAGFYNLATIIAWLAFYIFMVVAILKLGRQNLKATN